MDYDRMKEVFDTNIALANDLKRYNNMLAGIKFMMVFVIVILILILIKVMGWI